MRTCSIHGLSSPQGPPLAPTPRPGFTHVIVLVRQVGLALALIVQYQTGVRFEQMLFFSHLVTYVMPDTYKIVEIQRDMVFAGKLGKEVRETWKVQKDGQTLTVTISPYHTNVAHVPAFFKEGESVKISGFMREDRIKTSISEIKR